MNIWVAESKSRLMSASGSAFVTWLQQGAGRGVASSSKSRMRGKGQEAALRGGKYSVFSYQSARPTDQREIKAVLALDLLTWQHNKTVDFHIRVISDPEDHFPTLQLANDIYDIKISIL